MSTLASRIKRARKAKGITRVALAERAGTTQSIVGQLEAGMLRSSKAVPGIAKALDVSAGWLQYGDENKAAPAREALRKLCEEQQAKIEALLVDNATLAEAKSKLAEELEFFKNGKAIIDEALLDDNATLAEAKGKLAEELEALRDENRDLKEELEALRDENIALAKEAIGVATSLNAEQFQSFVADIRSMLRVAFVTGNHSVTVEDLQALVNHHTL